MRRLFLLLVILLPAALLAPQAAMAHAVLVASDPASGAVVAAAPAMVQLDFDEPVSPLAMELLQPDGRSLELAGRSLDDRVTVALPPGLSRGTHFLGWRVISADGHPVHGTLVFSIGASSAAAPVDASGGLPVMLALAIWLCRILILIAAVLGIGGAFFCRVHADAVPLSGLRRMLQAILVIGLAAIPLALAAQGADGLGLGLAGIVAPSAWSAGLDGSFGAAMAILALAVLAALAALAVPGPAGRGLAGLAWIGAGIAAAATGHAATASPQWLMRPLVFLHALSITYWIGALLPLAAMLRAGKTQGPLAAFSRAIPWALAALLISGVVIGVIQIGRPAALITTPYGIILSVKLGVVAVMLLLAAWNRFALTAPVLAGDDGAARRLARLVLAETLAAVVVLGLASGWRFTPPPRSDPPAITRSIHLHADKAMAMIDLTVDPDGSGRFAITPLDGDGVPVSPKELTLSAAPRDAGLAPLKVKAAPGPDGIWQAVVPGLGSHPRWRIGLELLVTDFDLLRLDGDVDLSAAPGNARPAGPLP